MPVSLRSKLRVASKRPIMLVISRFTTDVLLTIFWNIVQICREHRRALLRHRSSQCRKRVLTEDLPHIFSMAERPIFGRHRHPNRWAKGLVEWLNAQKMAFNWPLQTHFQMAMEYVI